MEDDRSAEAVEHLQAAARELLLAARSFLNVVEEVVEDRDRLVGAASSVVELLRDGVVGAMPPSSPLQPWEQAAWGAGTPSDPEPSDPDPSSPGEPAPEATATAPAATASAKKAPARKAPAAKAPRKAPSGTADATDAPPRRVRRISVD
jgi:hypothetical protein